MEKCNFNEQFANFFEYTRRIIYLFIIYSIQYENHTLSVININKTQKR